MEKCKNKMKVIFFYKNDLIDSQDFKGTKQSADCQGYY